MNATKDQCMTSMLVPHEQWCTFSAGEELKDLPPKAAKERVTCVPSKYKFKCGTGHGYPCMYMAIAISNRRTPSVFGKYNLHISMAPGRTW